MFYLPPPYEPQPLEYSDNLVEGKPALLEDHSFIRHHHTHAQNSKAQRTQRLQSCTQPANRTGFQSTKRTELLHSKSRTTKDRQGSNEIISYNLIRLRLGLGDSTRKQFEKQPGLPSQIALTAKPVNRRFSVPSKAATWAFRQPSPIVYDRLCQGPYLSHPSLLCLLSSFSEKTTRLSVWSSSRNREERTDSLGCLLVRYPRQDGKSEEQQAKFAPDCSSHPDLRYPLATFSPV